MIAQPQDDNSTPSKQSPNTKSKSKTKPKTKTKSSTNNRISSHVAEATPGRNPFQDHQVSSLYPESKSDSRSKKDSAKKRTKSNSRKPQAKGSKKKLSPRKSAMRTLVERTLIGHRKYQLDAISDVLKMFAGKAINEQGKRIDPVGSVMLEGSSGVGKSVIALMVASALQRKFGLTVAWTGSPERLAQVIQDNENYEIDVDLIPTAERRWLEQHWLPMGQLIGN